MMSQSRFDRWGHEGMPTGEEARRIQEGISRTLSDIVADRYNPIHGLPPSPTVTVVGATEVKTAFEPGGGRGWQRERPIESPMPNGSFIERVVGGMIDHTLGPALPPPTLASIRAQIQALTSEQRQEMLAKAEARRAKPGYVEEPARAQLRAMLEEAEAAAKEADR
jgi:hypothetical protein